MLLGIGVHLLIITPILGSPPVNQLLATGGLLFFIQSFATFLWTTDHRSVRLTLPTLEVGGMFLSFARLLAFALSILAMIGLYLFLTRTFIGTAIRAVSQDRERHGPDGRQPAAHLRGHLRGGRGHGRGGGRAADHPVLGAPVLRRRLRPASRS